MGLSLNFTIGLLVFCSVRCGSSEKIISFILNLALLLFSGLLVENSLQAHDTAIRAECAITAPQ